MGACSAFLKRKNIVLSAKRYGVDALGAMAQGLFCSLLIGTILDTLGKQLGIAFLVTVGGYASAMSGSAMAVAIGYALQARPPPWPPAWVPAAWWAPSGCTPDGSTMWPPGPRRPSPPWTSCTPPSRRSGRPGWSGTGPTASPWAGRCACSGRAGWRRPLPRRWTMPSPWWCAAPTAAGRRCPPARCPSGGCWGMCDFQKRGTCPALFA